MDKSKGRSYMMFAALSFASPFVAFGLILLYQAFAFDELPSGPIIDDADKNAATFAALVMVAQILLAVGAGWVVGLLLAAMSVWKRRRIVSLGTAAFIFNLLPLLFLLWRYVVDL